MPGVEKPSHIIQKATKSREFAWVALCRHGDQIVIKLRCRFPTAESPPLPPPRFFWRRGNFCAGPGEFLRWPLGISALRQIRCELRSLRGGRDGAGVAPKVAQERTCASCAELCARECAQKSAVPTLKVELWELRISWAGTFCWGNPPGRSGRRSRRGARGHAGRQATGVEPRGGGPCTGRDGRAGVRRRSRRSDGHGTCVRRPGSPGPARRRPPRSESGEGTAFGQVVLAVMQVNPRLKVRTEEAIPHENSPDPNNAGRN